MARPFVGGGAAEEGPRGATGGFGWGSGVQAMHDTAPRPNARLGRVQGRGFMDVALGAGGAGSVHVMHGRRYSAGDRSGQQGSGVL